MLSAREVWFDAQIDLDPDRLVFVDETWAEQRKVPRAKRVELLRRAAPTWRGATAAVHAASVCG
ncbi:ISRm2011-2 transposase protein [Acidiphilium sp. PM]|nr:ISRm2011-2 transposase protein [Acidiphilium sp. PM]